jgi:type IV secretion system protein VirB10
MRALLLILLSSLLVSAQTQSTNSSPKLASTPHAQAQEVTIPAGTRIPIALKNTISTKGNHEGDPIYAQSTFPVVVNDRIIVPAGTYVQGKISSIKPAGHIKGRAEVLIHFTTLIYPSGYTVLLPGSIDNAPGVDHAKVKDKEGTIQGDSNKGKTAATIAGPAADGALTGAVVRGGEGALIGAGIGGAIGTAIAAFSHGNEVKMPPGTTLEVVLQRDVAVDGSRITASPPVQRD